MIRWPWRRRDEQLAEVQQELKEAKQRTPRVNAKAERMERHLRENSFGQRINIALGGEGR